MGKKRSFYWLKFVTHVVALIERIRDMFDL